MKTTDPIADYLTRIQNALRAGHAEVSVPTSQMKVKLSEILQEEGFIGSFKVLPAKPRGNIVIQLRYRGKGKPMIERFERVSRSGCRVYASAEELESLASNITTSIVTTSLGIMTGRKAREAKVGGEVICRIY